MHFRLNLASRVYLDRRSVRRWLLLIGGMLALLLAVNLLYGWRNLQQLSLVDQQLAEIEGKLTVQRGRNATPYTPENFRRVMEEIGNANKIIAADQFRWTQLLSRLEALVPDDVAVRSLRPNYKDRSLQISAVARDTRAMTELLDALLKADDFGEVYLLNQASSEEDNGDSLVSFSIIIQEAF